VNGKAVFRERRETLAESASAVNSPTKFGDSRIITETAGQQPRLREIDLGGTTMRAEFN
jgi:hypothetical protein